MKNRIESYQCPLCKEPLSENKIYCKDLITNVKGRFIYVRCSSCGSYIQNPMPSIDFLAKCYSTQDLGYKRPPSEKKINFSISKYVTARSEYMFNKIWRTISPLPNTINLKPTIPAPARILEIGCSYGSRLLDLKNQGYEVKGIELSEESVGIALGNGLDVECKSVEMCSFPENSFDVVIMSMVLEHLRNPASELSQICKWVKPGGDLLISVPCADGFEFKRYLEYCYVIQPPYHIFIPTIKGLQMLLDPSFNINCIAFQAFHRDLVASAEFKGQSSSDATFYETILHLVNKSDSLKSLVRMMLLVYVHCGGKTSRVSLRCTKKQIREMIT
jgi:SAM-dependent methyltransferase